jgi:hypothetical protein
MGLVEVEEAGPLEQFEQAYWNKLRVNWDREENPKAFLYLFFFFDRKYNRNMDDPIRHFPFSPCCGSGKVRLASPSFFRRPTRIKIVTSRFLLFPYDFNQCVLSPARFN